MENSTTKHLLLYLYSVLVTAEREERREEKGREGKKEEERRRSATQSIRVASQASLSLFFPSTNQPTNDTHS